MHQRGDRTRIARRFAVTWVLLADRLRRRGVRARLVGWTAQRWMRCWKGSVRSCRCWPRSSWSPWLWRARCQAGDRGFSNAVTPGAGSSSLLVEQWWIVLAGAARSWVQGRGVRAGPRAACREGV